VDITGLVEKKNRRGTRYYENEDGEFAAKECTGCGEVKIISDFNKDKRGPGRRQPKCKSCRRNYHEKNQTSISDNRRKYYEENRAWFSERNCKYREENQASIAEYKRKYREENRTSISEYHRKHYEENRDSILRKNRKYYEENRASLSEKARNYREENHDYILERSRKYYEENRVSLAEHKRKNREENYTSILENERKYREENRTRISEKQRKYNEENRDSILRKNRKYKEENRDSILEHQRKYHKENHDYILDRSRKYYEENPHVAAAGRHRRRARKSALPDTLTKEKLEEITDRFHGGCALTGCTDGTHLDHVIPLATGHGGTTEQNMIPLRADLNYSKNARCIFDWFYDVKDHFNLPQTKFDELIEYLADINGMTADEYEGYVRGCHDNQR